MADPQPQRGSATNMADDTPSHHSGRSTFNLAVAPGPSAVARCRPPSNMDGIEDAGAEPPEDRTTNLGTELGVDYPEDSDRSNSTSFRNKTLASNFNSQGTTIIVSAVGENSESFLRNPVLLAKAIRDSPFGKIDHKDIRTNIRRNIVAIELKERNENVISNLLKVTKLGRWTIKCHRPNADISCFGVVGPIHPDLEISEIFQNIHAKEKKIIGISRLEQFQRGTRKPSSSIKVQFEGKTLPDKVYLDMVSFPVRLYVPPPLRCFKCQRLGHTASGCSSAQRCLLCAGNHNKDQCSSPVNKCANCGGAHKASSNYCEYIIRAKEQLNQSGRAGNTNVSTSTNSNTIDRSGHTTLSPPESGSRMQISAEVDVHRSLASPHLERNSQETEPHLSDAERWSFFRGRAKSGERAPAQPQCKCSSTQVTQLESRIIQKLETIENNLKQENQKILVKIGNLLNEMFSIRLSEEGVKERKLLLLGMIRNNLGGDISEALCKQWNSPIHEDRPSESKSDHGSSEGSIETDSEDVSLAPTPSGKSLYCKGDSAASAASVKRKRNRRKTKAVGKRRAL